jgi:hypothetical protein
MKVVPVQLRGRTVYEVRYEDTNELAPVHQRGGDLAPVYDSDGNALCGHSYYAQAEYATRYILGAGSK